MGGVYDLYNAHNHSHYRETFAKKEYFVSAIPQRDKDYYRALCVEFMISTMLTTTAITEKLSVFCERYTTKGQRLLQSLRS